MRRLRHLAAVLMGVLLLQMTLLGSGLACAAVPSEGGAEHAHAGAHGPPSAGDAEHGHHDAAPTRAPASDRQGDSPGQLHCLAAMSCTTGGVAAVATALPAAEPETAHRVAALDAAAPASIVGAPEPPPPRA
jgi:Mrp family chromosome partitioning ATPase